jgi:ABC-type multidrug transport system ATPase subunit
MTDALLVARGLVAGYGPTTVLRGVDVSLVAGEIVGLAGENGSGKSTLLEVLAGAKRARAGERLARATVGYCPQYPALLPRLSVQETLRVFGTAAGIDDGPQAAMSLLEPLGLLETRAQRVEALSGGQRQKLSLAITLLPDPPVLLLDEPYQGLDMASYQAFWALMEARRARGHAILVVSHLLLEPHRLSRLVMLHDGRLG